MLSDEGAPHLDPAQLLAAPTKALFVEMLTRDLSLESAIMDLVDNCIDGARRIRGDNRFDDLYVRLTLDSSEFRIEDNCGGISLEMARLRAFRFGRPKDAPPTPNSIGQFGVGMKRALFKFGRSFKVDSATVSDSFSLSVDVDKWEDESTPWIFELDSFHEDEQRNISDTGTTIIVTRLRDEAESYFGRVTFQDNVMRVLEEAQQTNLERGIDISCNGRHLTAIEWRLIDGNGIHPGFSQEVVLEDGRAPVNVRVYVGVSDSNPSQAGWYVCCNGRVIVSADQSSKTAWTRTTETAKSPKYHNQFARFRGYVFFDSEDASLLPWNTTKDDLDVDSVIYERVLEDMVDAMRPVIDFLNALDAEDEEAAAQTPLHDALRQPRTVKIQAVDHERAFTYPDPQAGPAMARISFSKERDKVLELKDELGVSSNKDLGLRCFDYTYAQLIGEVDAG